MKTKSVKKNPMEITEKFYQIVSWYTSRISRFPKQSRILLGQPLQERLLNIMDLLIEAVYSPKREILLIQINIGLDRVRYLTRLCLDQQLLSLKQMEYAAKELNIVGGMLGNWIKTLRSKVSSS